MKRFFGMMPAKDTDIDRIYKDQSGLRVHIQAGPHGWTIIWADASSTFSDCDATSEENFKTAYNTAIDQIGGLSEPDGLNQSDGRKQHMKIFLGGTCNESTWRDELIKSLKVDYFNPVVDDWTPECQKKEIEERKNCDLVLYTITPKMTGVYSIAEVVDDSNKRSDKTILCLLKDSDDKSFNDGQWKSLESVATMVSENGAKVFYSLDEVSEYVNSKAALSPMLEYVIFDATKI